MFVWLGLVVLRIGWAVLPQTGYIHPDEYFQTVEVVAGDALDISVERTWEFNQSFPLRSILIPKLLFHPAFKLLKMISENTGAVRITGRHIICASRLTMALLSVSLEACLFHMCMDLNIHSQTGLLLLSSSYVSLTYLTHTFSNSIEALLLAAVIMLIIKSANRDKIFEMENMENENNGKESKEERLRSDSSLSDDDSDVLNDSYGMLGRLHSSAFDMRRRKQKQSEEENPLLDTPDYSSKFKENVNSLEKPEIEEEGDCSSQQYLEQLARHRSKNSSLICVLLAVLNTAGIFNRPTFVLFSAVPFMWWICRSFTNIPLLICRITIFIIVSMATALLFCIVDTLYYNNMSLTDLANVDELLPKLVFTPLNFILYNTKFDNLAQHGRHPFYLHCFINMPLLFGPLVFYLWKGVFKTLKQWSQFLFKSKNDNSSMEDGSGLISHRLLLGFVFAPIIFLSVFPHQEPRFLIPLLPLVILYVVFSNDKLSNLFWCTFYLFNITLAILYGVFHQGGLVPCLIRLQDIAHSHTNEKSLHVLFSHTYMPPRHTLLIKKTSNINIYDLKGASFSKMHDLVFQLKMSDLNLNLSNSGKLFIVLPGSLVREFKQEISHRLKLKVMEKFFPHLSMEDPPVVHAGDRWTKIKNMMSLFLMEVEDL